MTILAPVSPITFDNEKKELAALEINEMWNKIIKKYKDFNDEKNIF